MDWISFFVGVGVGMLVGAAIALYTCFKAVNEISPWR